MVTTFIQKPLRVSIPQAVSTVATTDGGEGAFTSTDLLRVSIPQAVSTVATNLIVELEAGKYLKFQYRKR